MTAKKIFVDTSAFLAVMDASDRCHAQAASIWEKLIRTRTILVISSYVLVETCAVIQRHLGMEALRLFCTNVCPGLEVFWVGPDLHAAGVDAVLAAGRRRLSLVDCVSFAVMRRNSINTAFTFDLHENWCRMPPNSLGGGMRLSSLFTRPYPSTCRIFSSPLRIHPEPPSLRT